MIGKTNAGGGGGINYRIVGGTTQPTVAENLIWINTAAAITGHVFAADAPASPTEGQVWIYNGLTSYSGGQSKVAAFNALKRGVMMVYPTFCAQYVSGVWVQKSAKIYKNGAWVDFAIPLYNGGLADGWEGVAVNWGAYQAFAPAITSTSAGDSWSISRNGGNAAGIVRTTQPYDLTAAHYVKFDLYFIGKPFLMDGVFADQYANGYGDNGTVTTFGRDGNEGRVLYSIDVSSLTGYYYLGVRISAANEGYHEYKFYHIWIE